MKFLHRLSKPWVTYLPVGLRAGAGWFFLAIAFALTGIAYVVGASESDFVTEVLGRTWTQIWGAHLFVTGSIMAYAIIRQRLILKRLSLRMLSVGVTVYGNWLLIVAPTKDSLLSIVMCLTLAVLAEIRAAEIKQLLVLKGD